MAETPRITTLVVDDEPLARDLIAGYVRETPFLELSGSVGSGMEALTFIQQRPVDLLLLDIQMPQLNGLELSKMLGEHTRVIFTTAFEQYALEGFRVDALDYLLKPISYAEFLRAATKAQRWFNPTAASGVTSAVESDGSAQSAPITPQSLLVKSEYKMVQVPLEQILYIEGVKDYVKIHRTDETSILTQMSLKTMEETLPADRFVRVHRSFIVQVNQIRTIDRNRIVFGRTYIPISDSYREHFMEVLARRSLML